RNNKRYQSKRPKRGVVHSRVSSIPSAVITANGGHLAPPRADLRHHVSGLKLYRPQSSTFILRLRLRYPPPPAKLVDLNSPTKNHQRMRPPAPIVRSIST